MSKKLISLLLTIVLLVSSAMSCYAEGDNVSSVMTEVFVRQELFRQYSLIYDTFSAAITLNDGTEITGIGFTDYSAYYEADDGSVGYFPAGFIADYGYEIPETDEVLVVENLDFTDERYQFVYDCETVPFMEHCVKDGQYLKYGVNEQGSITYETSKYERGVCDESLGLLFSYDTGKIVFDPYMGNYVRINGVPLFDQIDFDAIEAQANQIIADQNNHFSEQEIISAVHLAQESIISYLLSMQEETFLGYKVAELVEYASQLDPMECVRITPDETLTRLLNNEEAMRILMNIEGFRSLNSDIETIINKSEAIKKAKRDKGDDLTPKEKKKLTEDEKEMKSKRKQIQEKLIKFATRVPIFMYLSEYRERSLKDVITLLEPKLFKMTTGLNVKDFELLCSLNVFNGEVMDQAVWQFKRYEDSSLSYTGINRHAQEDQVGGWDTVLRREEFDVLFSGQQGSLKAPPVIKEIPAKAAEPAKDIRKTYLSNQEPEKATEEQSVRTRPSFARNPHTGIRLPESPVKEHADVSGIGPGSKVIHKSFGEGIVDKIDAAQKYIHVRFGRATKMFVFPDSFDNGFLRKK